MTTHVIYHQNCYDGYGAAWAAWKALGDKAKYIPANYGDAPPELPRDANVVIADFSYPRAVLEELRSRVATLWVLDHHKTSMEDLKDFPQAVFDMNHSGAYLAWEYFHGPDNVPEFVRYLEDRDLWKFELPESREVSMALRSYPFDFQTWSDLAESVDLLKAEGVTVRRHTETMVGIMCDNAVFRDVGGYNIPVANATVYFSEVGEELCKRYPDAPFAAYYLDRKDGKRQWGLRSRGGFDVSQVAKQYGGGGHPGAAGFTETVPVSFAR